MCVHESQNSGSIPSYPIMITQDFFIWWESLDNLFRNAFPPHFHTAAASVLYQMPFCHESNCFLIFLCLKTCLAFLNVSVGPIKSISCLFKSCSFSIIKPSHQHYYYEYLHTLHYCFCLNTVLSLRVPDAVNGGVWHGFSAILLIWYLHLLGSLTAFIFLRKICKSRVR